MSDTKDNRYAVWRDHSGQCDSGGTVIHLQSTWTSILHLGDSDISIRIVAVVQVSDR